jgi:uncharacterized protein YcfJ
MLTPLSLPPSFGFGGRLEIATPGHIAAVRGTGFAPVFAQQSVRENAQTGRRFSRKRAVKQAEPAQHPHISHYTTIPRETY